MKSAMATVWAFVREQRAVVAILVIGAIVVGAVGFIAESTTGAMWAGGAVGVVIGMVIAWQQGRREESQRR